MEEVKIIDRWEPYEEVKAREFYKFMQEVKMGMHSWGRIPNAEELYEVAKKYKNNHDISDEQVQHYNPHKK